LSSKFKDSHRSKSTHLAGGGGGGGYSIRNQQAMVRVGERVEFFNMKKTLFLLTFIAASFSVNSYATWYSCTGTYNSGPNQGSGWSAHLDLTNYQLGLLNSWGASCSVVSGLVVDKWNAESVFRLCRARESHICGMTLVRKDRVSPGSTRELGVIDFFVARGGL
jgi:hypothetical protein